MASRMTPDQLRQVETAYWTAWGQLQEAATERDEAIRQAVEEGMSTREIGAATNLSFQRVSQIARRPGHKA